MSEEEELAERRMDQTAERLQKLAGTNAPYGAKVTAEQNYGQAYEALARLGLRRPLRGKYRAGGRL